jgi:hypothetical protein
MDDVGGLMAEGRSKMSDNKNAVNNQIVAKLFV